MKPHLAIVDYNVTANSPAGSCVLAEVEGLAAEYDITVFSDRFENPDPSRIRWVRVPLPPQPGTLRDWLFPKLLPAYFGRERARTRFALVQATQGQLPGADVVYAHFCHRIYLERYWSQAGATGIRRLTRLLSHRRNARREARAFASARLVVVPSRGLEAELIEAYPFLEGRTVCIPNPIDTERFSRPEGFDGTSLRAEHGLRPEELVAVFVALGDFARKGLKLAMEAIAVADLAAVRLLVVGGQPGEIEVFRKIARTLGIESRIVFAGFRRDIRPFLWASDLFVFPSLYETFCLVAFQAALAQLPLILTRVHGVEDFIQPGEHGWLVQRDAIAVRQALRQALADPGRLSAMGRAAALAAQSYSKGAFVQRWRQAYRDLESGAFRRTAHA